MAAPPDSTDKQKPLSSQALAEVILGGMESLVKNPLQFLVLGFIGFVLTLVVSYVASNQFWEALCLGAVVASAGGGLYLLLSKHAKSEQGVLEASEAIERTLDEAEADFKKKEATLGDKRFDPKNLSKARSLYTEARLLYHLKKDTAGEARALLYLGGVAAAEEAYPKAREHSQKALALYKQLGDEKGQAQALLNLGGVAAAEEAYPKAGEYFKKALALLEQLGDTQTANVAREALQALP